MHKKILNFRDIGGIQVSGGHVKPHKLLRGGPLEHLDSQTVNRLLNEYELKTVIDLRTLDEQDRQPNDMIDGLTYVHLDILGRRQRTTADPMRMMNQVKSTVAHDHMCQLNNQLVRDDHAQMEYRQFFKELLLNEEGAVYFHCSAGKDRTGFAAAQILKILGASEEDIMKDYLRTNELNKDNQQEMLEKMMEKFPDVTPEQIENYRGYTIVDPEYIGTAFRAIEEDYGTFDTYVQEVLQLSADDILKLNEIYVG
ncbi:tyrosine-protein phosphatase [Erysipelothrix sp. HDW6C]|nr:tyrosine-protein phosphatase [Erysipelothrix sp. HDW6C]